MRYAILQKPFRPNDPLSLVEKLLPDEPIGGHIKSVHCTATHRTPFWHRIGAERVLRMLPSLLQKFVGVAVLATALSLTGCSDQPQPHDVNPEAAKKPSIPEGAIPALTAYYEIYKVARTLAPDLQTASITGNEVEGVKSEDGKYAQWTVVFVSASTQQAYTFLYSTVEKGPVLRGINNQGSMRWAGATQNAESFTNSDFSVDSPAAFKAASEKAKAWLAKNPDKPVTTFALGHSARFPAPMWVILWGTPKNGFATYVNASTGTVWK
jgi:hypothetical protein